MNSPRVYQLPQDKYALVQAVKGRLGHIAGAALTCVFSGSVTRLEVPADHEKIIRDMAREKGIPLPL